MIVRLENKHHIYVSDENLPHEWKAFYMSFKKFSSVQSAANKLHGPPFKVRADDKSKAVPTASQPVAQPEKTSIEITPTQKS
jgi:hypothetical protein